MHFNYIPVASEFSNSEEAITNIIADFIAPLQQIGGVRSSADCITSKEPLFFLSVTGGVEQPIFSLAMQRHELFPKEPVFILAHPGNNSLPASLEVLARLQQDNISGRIFYLSGADSKESFNQVAQAVQNLETARRLSGLRIGLIGTPSDWLIASMPSAESVSAQWGPQIIPVSLDEVKELIASAEESELSAHVKSLTGNSSQIVEPSGEDIKNVARVYTALRKIVAKYSLSALSVRCFDLVVELKTTGCFALAELIDEGIIAGCEGDLNSTIGMLWANYLLGEIPWMANPAQIDEQKNALWLAHCTVPRKIVKSYKLRSHFESGLGVGIQGIIPEGPVTLIRIGGKSLEKIWLEEGMITQNGSAENLCRTQIEVQLINGGSVSDLLKAPLGNHLTVIRGHHKARLSSSYDAMQ